MTKRFKYRARVFVEGELEETQFERLEEGAPALPARYAHGLDGVARGKFAHGEIYIIDPNDPSTAAPAPKETKAKETK